MNRHEGSRKREDHERSALQQDIQQLRSEDIAPSKFHELIVIEKSLNQVY
jgi:hypothetical protein